MRRKGSPPRSSTLQFQFHSFTIYPHSQIDSRAPELPTHDLCYREPLLYSTKREVLRVFVDVASSAGSLLVPAPPSLQHGAPQMLRLPLVSHCTLSERWFAGWQVGVRVGAISDLSNSEWLVNTVSSATKKKPRRLRYSI